ncbi:hypothetical protein Trydic_g14563 [Trypoxylus dichotomus]
MYLKGSSSSSQRRNFWRSHSRQSASSLVSGRSTSATSAESILGRINLNWHDKTLIGIISVNFAIFLILIWLMVRYSAMVLDCYKILSGEIEEEDHTDDSYLYYDQ